jgi:hypothetical protein
MRKIDPKAYNALADALSVIYWNKPPFARYLRGVLADAPEVLSGLDFQVATKRETAGVLVDRLMRNEAKYQALTISLMLSVAEMDAFSNLEKQENKEQLVAEASQAVAELRRWTKQHSDIAKEHQRTADAIAHAAKDALRSRAFSESITKLKHQFMEMHANSTDPQARGRAFEGFLNQLFGLWDLEPRAAYSLEREQIDGAFSFDTDDYIMEARWWKGPIPRDDLDVFATKIKRKGKNALGLYISVNGYTADALAEYESGTPFVTMDGGDIFAVLDERVRLDDMLRRKKRHANETGDCHYPAALML